MVYLPPAFTETREEILVAHIERHDFGLLVTQGSAGLIASQIPFLIARRDGKLYLEGHIALANPQDADLDGGDQALAIVCFDCVNRVLGLGGSSSLISRSCSR